MPQRTLLFVGTYTRPAPNVEEAKGEGIYTYSLNRETGEIAPLAKTEHIDSPSYLTLDPTGRFLYAASEVWRWNEGIVSAYAIDRDNGELAYLNKQPTLGSLSAHVSVDHSGRYVLLANYLDGKGAVMLPVRADGGLAPVCSAVEFEGSGPHEGQEKSHFHFILPDPTNRYAFVADLGSDMLVSYRLDLDGGTLIENFGSNVRLEAGSGPRHYGYHPSGKFVYLIQEHSSTITTLAYDDGRMTALQTVSTVPEDFDAYTHCSAIRISPDGRFVYGANRGHDSIAVFAVDPQRGTLTRVEVVSTKGRTPRDFNLDPSGTFLLAANQDSDTIVTFRIDRETGRLDDTGFVASVPTPVCLQMLEV